MHGISPVDDVIFATSSTGDFCMFIEMFSIDTQVSCEKCGFLAYNDTLSCVQWCQYARKCVGDEMYEHMMEIAAAQKARK